jgi:hypothetical protein
LSRLGRGLADGERLGVGQSSGVKRSVECEVEGEGEGEVTAAVSRVRLRPMTGMSRSSFVSQWETLKFGLGVTWSVELDGQCEADGE